MYYIHQPSGRVCNIAGLVLKQQLIAENLGIIFYNKRFMDESTCFTCGNFLDLHTLQLCVLNKNKSLRVLKPHVYLRFTCVNN